jgi:hypothetical protein
LDGGIGADLLGYVWVTSGSILGHGWVKYSVLLMDVAWTDSEMKKMAVWRRFEGVPDGGQRRILRVG